MIHRKAEETKMTWKQVFINLLTRKMVAFDLSLLATFLLTLWEKIPKENFSYLVPVMLTLLIAGNVVKAFTAKSDSFTKT